MKKIFYLLLMPLFFSGTRANQCSQSEIVINRVIFEFKKIIENEGLILIGTGGSEKDGKSKIIDLLFETNEELTAESAHQVILKISRTLLDYINSKKNIEEFVAEYPVTLKSISLGIISRKYKENSPNKIKMVTLGNNKIRYFIENPNNNLNLICVLEEDILNIYR